MKITYIATSTIPSRTANSIHVMKMCQAFAQHGHEVTLIVPDNQANCEPGVEDVFDFYGVEGCFKILYLPLLPVKGKGLIYGFHAAKKTKELQPDIIYGRDLPGCFFASLLKVPVIFESHAPIEGFVYGNIFNRLIQRPELMKLVVITHALKDYYSSRYPFISDRIVVAPDGADPVPDDAIPVVLPNKGKRLQVGYVGHLYKGKGMEIISNLAPRCDWADFHIIGGLDNDITYWKRATSNIKNILYYGYLPHSKTISYTLAFDVVLVPNQKKVSAYGGESDIGKWTSPMKIFEYMAAGKPIICSDIPVLREVLVDEQNAILCDPENIDLWEEALTILSENENVRIQLGETAQKDFARRYSWYSRAEKLLMDISTK